MRTANVNRKTKETEISVQLNLDGSGDYQIDTGIGFFDHMLTQIAVHGLFDLSLKATGDLHIDPHHTIEDSGLTLGTAFAEAMGNKAGIVRTASAFVPMDDALSHVVIDFSGRPYSVINTAWTSPTVGGVHTTLLEHSSSPSGSGWAAISSSPLRSPALPISTSPCTMAKIITTWPNPCSKHLRARLLRQSR